MLKKRVDVYIGPIYIRVDVYIRVSMYIRVDTTLMMMVLLKPTMT